MTMSCDLISIEDVYNENLKVEETREVNEESISVPTTNYFGPIFLAGLL
jgi:hypothetical protein